MKLIDNYKTIKNRNNNSIVLIRSGVFYETFNNDAYIMNYLFDYKIKEFSSYIMVGFPVNVIDSVKGKLNIEQLDYIIVDNNNYHSNKNKDNKVKYKVLLDVSKKTYLIDTEIKDIQHKLDILKKQNQFMKYFLK